MRKLPKLLAVVLAIAIIICPAMCLTSIAAESSNNGYDIQLTGDTLNVEVNPSGGFLAALVKIRLVGYSVYGADEDGWIASLDTDVERITARGLFEDGVLSIVVAPSALNDVELAESVNIAVELVKNNEAKTHTIALTHIQAAKIVDSETGELEKLIELEGVDGETGEIATPKVICAHTTTTTRVVKQPTKDALGVMSHTCECGATFETDIDKPEKLDAKIQHNLKLSDTVIDRFVFSVKQIAEAGYDAVNNDYFVVVDYEKYKPLEDGYFFADTEPKYYYDADKDEANSSGNGRSFLFNELALYEMTTDYTITVYIEDENGVVVAYITDTTNLAEVALAYADKNSTDTDLLTCLADMMKYGEAAQAYFDVDGDDLSKADSPTTILGDAYMAYASNVATLPAELPDEAAGLSKVVPTTSFNAKGSPKVEASTIPSFMVVAGTYVKENVEITVSYVNGYGRTVTEPVIVEPYQNNSGNWRYDFTFALAMYDLSETVTVTMKYNGDVEATYEYALSSFVNDNKESEKYSDLVKKMALFSRSARIQLDLAPAY